MKKLLLKSPDLLSFFLAALSGFGINLVTDKIKEGGLLFIWGICLTFSGIVLFWWYRRWISNIDIFDFFIRSEAWEKKNFGGVETWTCKDTDEYQLIIGNVVVSNFRQPWTEIFPDNEHNESRELFLKRNGIIVREFLWVYCDGGRVFMPVPESNKGEPYFKKDSLKFRMLEKIGNSVELDFDQIFKDGKIQII